MIKRQSIVGLFIILLLTSCASSTAMGSAGIKMPEMEKMISYSGRMTIEVADIKKERQLIVEECQRLGGFVTKNSDNYLLIRIPYIKYEEFFRIIDESGKMKMSEMNGEDITEEYEDTILRLESKRALRGKYHEILLKAIEIQDMLAIEKELERINTEIQYFEGKKIESEKRVEYVTLVIFIEKKIIPGPLGWPLFIIFKGLRWLFIWE